MGSGGRGGGLPRVSEAQVSRAEHLAAPPGGPLRPQPDLFLPGRQQEQRESASVGAPPGRATPGRHVCGAVDRGRAPDRGRAASIRQSAAKTLGKRARARAGEGLGLTRLARESAARRKEGLALDAKGERKSGTPAGLA